MQPAVGAADPEAAVAADASPLPPAPTVAPVAEDTPPRTRPVGQRDRDPSSRQRVNGGLSSQTAAVGEARGADPKAAESKAVQGGADAKAAEAVAAARARAGAQIAASRARSQTPPRNPRSSAASGSKD